MSKGEDIIKSYQTYKCRRIGLNWSRDILAEKAGVDVQCVRWFENGQKIGIDYENKIKSAISQGYKELSEVEHYKARLIELAYEIRFENDAQYLMQRIGHTITELGKLQMKIVD